MYRACGRIHVGQGRDVRDITGTGWTIIQGENQCTTINVKIERKNFIN
jgi:hypothetical protein